MYRAENHRPAPTLQVKSAATPGQEGTVRLYAHVHYMKGNTLKCSNFWYCSDFQVPYDNGGNMCFVLGCIGRCDITFY